MTVEYIPHPDAQDLARQEKGFYPVKIPVSHWQLRHYISTPEQDHLYYASAGEIYCLNTATKKRKHIATLPFEARCTASGYGYVCIGGEDEGRFASIKLDGSHGHGALDVDSALPIESWRPSVGARAPRVKVERIGEEIVNSISIHRIQDEEAHLDDIVAVLTNNDKTVRIYSLPAGQETRVKDLPFAINHATISPDGHMLVAVGDYNQAYFFTRDILDTPPQIPKPHNRLTSASVEWRLTNVVTLHVSSPVMTVGYFTTAWSPSGHLCAVGSEGGYITVFDTEILADLSLDDDDAVVAIVPGSRPDQAPPFPGAIRSLLFSPEPWDLLIWAEDQGRICIGDLRTGLKSRQVIDLHPGQDRLERLAYQDLHDQPVVAHVDDLEADLLRRYRNVPETAVNFATEYREARRRQRPQRQGSAPSRSSPTAAVPSGTTPQSSEPSDDPPGLTAREQEILESLRTSRQRAEARANGRPPRSVNYTTPDMFPASGPRSTSSSTEILTSLQESMPPLARTIAAGGSRPTSSHVPDDPTAPLHLRSLGEGVWEFYSPLYSLDASRPPPQRLEQSVANPTDPNPTSDSRPSAASSIPVLSEPDDDNENPWRTNEGYLPAVRGPLFEGAARAPPPAEIVLQRQQNHQRLRQQQDSDPRRVRLRPSGPADDPSRTLTSEETRTILSRAWRFDEPDPDPNESDLPSLIVHEPPHPTLPAIPPPPPPPPPAAAAAAAAAVAARRVFGRSGAAPLASAIASSTAAAAAAAAAVTEPRIGVRTAGLALSPDGSRLWAACEEGIFEVEVEVHRRLSWRAVEKR